MDDRNNGTPFNTDVQPEERSDDILSYALRGAKKLDKESVDRLKAIFAEKEKENEDKSDQENE